MKNFKFLLAVLLGFSMTATSLFAGSLDYLSNQSARFLIVPSRNAATDAADIVAYNPSGTALLAPGFHMDLSSQTFLKFYEQDMKVSGAPAVIPNSSIFHYETDLEQSKPTQTAPNLYLVYNFGEVGPGKLAAYFEAGVTAGGGKLDWANGTAGTNFALTSIALGANSVGADLHTISSQSFRAESMYITSGVGAAYAFLDDKVSVSLGGRVVRAMRGFELTATYDSGDAIKAKYDYNAWGFTPVVGLSVKPISKLTLSARYEYETDLEFKYDEKKKSLGSDPRVQGLAAGVLSDAGIQDGKKFNQNLPHIIGFGAEYGFTDRFLVTASSTIYLLSQADLNGTEDHLETGWEIGAGVKYFVTKEIQLGAGFLYTSAGAKKSYFNSEDTMLNSSANPLLDSVGFSLGGTYNSEDLGIDFTLGFFYVHYLAEDYKLTTDKIPGYSVSGEYRKDVLNIGFGVGYHI